MIPYGRQDISDQDINAVVDVLRSDWLTQGPAIERFEHTVLQYCGAGYAVATCNATSALHIACLSLGLGPGDILWTVPNTFVASANCGLYCGASVDFVDIDPHSYNMSVDALSDKLLKAKASGRLPKVVIPVHFAGQSCEMRQIKSLSKQYGFRIIEDASHAIGGKYLGEPVGAGTYSDITIFSFHPVKIVTSGEGGMALTNDPDIASRMRLLRSHGITRESLQSEEEGDGAWSYWQVELGYNYRMTDMQAALGASQMTRINAFVSRRREIARRYQDRLANMPVVLPWEHPESQSAYHLYPIKLVQGDRKAFYNHLRRSGIGVNVHYIPVHTQPYYRSLGFKYGDFPAAERYYEQTISLPMFPALIEEQQDLVIAKIEDFFK